MALSYRRKGRLSVAYATNKNNLHLFFQIICGGAATTADVAAWTAAIETIVSATGASRSTAVDAEGTTEITEAEAAEATVVAVYNLQGARVVSLQPGLNILLMSDGSTRKVLIND